MMALVGKGGYLQQAVSAASQAGSGGLGEHGLLVLTGPKRSLKETQLLDSLPL